MAAARTTLNQRRLDSRSEWVRGIHPETGVTVPAASFRASRA
jgi:hypothetical protein